MDPLDIGDAGGMGVTLDSVTGAVKAVDRLAAAANDASSFELVWPFAWGVLLLLAARKFIGPWNDGAAERWTKFGIVFDSRSRKDFLREIDELKAQLKATREEIDRLRPPALTVVQ